MIATVFHKLRSVKLTPPATLGLQRVFQATRAFHETSALSVHKNLLKMFSITYVTSLGSTKICDQEVCIENGTLLISCNLPA